MWEKTLLHLAGFLIGSIPVGYLIARCKGVDIRRHGSGNVGATNVGRTLGKSAGIITLILDAAKGAIATLLPLYLYSEQAPILAPTVGFCAILGHCFSPFLRFRGGKGVATSLGVFLILTPSAALAAVAVFAAVALSSGYVSLGSIIGAWAVPLTVALGEKGPGQLKLLLVGVASALLIAVKHRTNISRLRRREESRYTFSKPPGTK